MTPKSLHEINGKLTQMSVAPILVHCSCTSTGLSWNQYDFIWELVSASILFDLLCSGRTSLPPHLDDGYSRHLEGTQQKKCCLLCVNDQSRSFLAHGKHQS
uniref:Uncharacterized protein n=1 Tax=Salix viminalis TaxID=40686 RepID=A0A6N2L116_SALVM